MILDPLQAIFLQEGQVVMHAARLVHIIIYRRVKWTSSIFQKGSSRTRRVATRSMGCSRGHIQCDLFYRPRAFQLVAPESD